MINFNKKLQQQFNKMTSSGKLFRVVLTGQEIWDLYLASFDADPIFRSPESSSHNCNNCKNFIRRYGNIVSIDENFKINSLFDFDADEEYIPVAKALSKAIQNSTVTEVFFETFNELNSLPYEVCHKSNLTFRLGIDKNTKRYTKEEAELYLRKGEMIVKLNELRAFNHIHLNIPKEFVNKGNDSVEKIMASYRDAKNVFQRGMEEIPLDVLELCVDLINQKSLKDGLAHLYKVEQMIPFKTTFDSLKESEKDNWCWVTSYKLPFAKFKNELIGTTCIDLATKDINEACQIWNKRVDPVNYMKMIAPFSTKQKKEAEDFIIQHGYLESFNRRCATLADIRVSEIKHINSGKGELKEISIFDNLKAAPTKTKENSFDGIEEVPIETFMSKILPTCTSVEALLKNSHESNLVTLTTANIPESKSMFKYGNSYSKTFIGDLAGISLIKETVKNAGGKVDGVLRFSIMWAEKDGDNSDLDAHCHEPTGHISFMNKLVSSGGNLDIDIQRPETQMPKGAVENITYPNLKNMRDGSYVFSVNQYSGRNSKGFKAEIEFNDKLYSYSYVKKVSGTIKVATVTLKGGVFTIENHLPVVLGGSASREIYALETNKFHKVNLICLSPNLWDGIPIGNKYYLFMLENCKSPVPIKSFHSEDFNDELTGFRRVLEGLGNITKIPSTEGQLSGIGFNETIKDELIVKLQGSFNRVVKIKF